MPFVSVPKDLTKLKTKVAFNLTKRQIVCFSMGGAIGVPAYLVTRHSIGNENAVLFMISLMLPFFLFAMYEKNGQPLEKILRNYVRTTFFSPQSRPYQTENIYSAINRTNQYEKEAKAIEQKTGETTKGIGNSKKSVEAGQKRPAKITFNRRYKAQQKR